MSVLADFLGQTHWVCPNLNDTFYYASADSEQLTVGDGELLAAFYEKHGWYGLVALVAIKRERMPLREVQENPRFTQAYTEALADAELREECEVDE